MLVRFACFSCLLLGWVSASSGAIAVSSSVQLDAIAQQGSDPLVHNADSDSQGATTNALAANAEAVSTSLDGSFSATSGELSATWNNASAGAVTFSNLTLLSSAEDGFMELVAIFRYTFTTNEEGSLNVDYGVDGNGGFGTVNFTVAITPDGGDETAQTAVLNTAGQLSFSLLGSTTYLLQIGAGPNVSGATEATGSVQSGEFDWQVIDTTSTVPEPATLTIWTLGALGCAVFSLRRNRAIA